MSWSEIESLIKILSDLISKSSRTFSSISTLSRGGLVPSRLLADHLGIQKIFVDQQTISSNSLVVDDIFLILVQPLKKFYLMLMMCPNYFL